MGNKTITTTINTAARGPKGDPGTDAEVTQTNIEAAITDKPGFREEIEAVGTDGTGADAEVFRLALGTDFAIDPRLFGVVVGNNVPGLVRTQNTEALQMALDTGRSVFFSTYPIEIDDWLYLRCSGQRITSESGTRAVIRQTNAAAGHFMIQPNDVDEFPENPPGGSAGVSSYVEIERLFLDHSTASAEAGIMVELPPGGVGTLYPSGQTWMEDNLRCRDLWIQGYSLPGGRGIDLYSSAKIFMDRILLKNCDIGVKVYGGSSNCQHWHGLSFNECRIGFWGTGMTGSTIIVSDTSTGVFASGAPVHEANFKLIDCEVSIFGGEIEFNDLAASKNALFLDAEGGRINLQNQRILCTTGIPHSLILARGIRTIATSTAAVGAPCYTHVEISNISRTGHTSGVPLAVAGGNTAYITSRNQGDFLSSTLSSTIQDNAFQVLAWSGGTKQVETATAAGTITAAGTVDVTVTSDRLYGSPLTIPVAVALSDTASDWAAKVRTALAADYQIARVFTVGGTTTEITLTETISRANDSTLNIAIANGTATGVTAAPTSADPIVGVTGETVRINQFAWLPADSFTTPAANMEGMIFQTPGSSVTTNPGGDLRTVVRDASANPGTSTVYRWASLTRPNRRVLRVTNAAGHFGHPDLIIQANTSGAIATPLLATSSTSYRAAVRGGISIKVKNASGFTNTVVPNGADTINGVGAALSLASGESVELFTLGDGAWITL